MAPPTAAAPRVALSTSAGDFVVELYVNEAPQTCENFMELAKRGYYDGTKVKNDKANLEYRRRRPPCFDVRPQYLFFFFDLAPCCCCFRVRAALLHFGCGDSRSSRGLKSEEGSLSSLRLFLSFYTHNKNKKHPPFSSSIASSATL